MPGNVAIALALTAVAGLSTSIGGVKDSGWGRHGGLAALEEFTELRWVTMQRTPRQYPF